MWQENKIVRSEDTQIACQKVSKIWRKYNHFDMLSIKLCGEYDAQNIHTPHFHGATLLHREPITS